jgi:hypothetical protein
MEIAFLAKWGGQHFNRHVGHDECPGRSGQHLSGWDDTAIHKAASFIAPDNQCVSAATDSSRMVPRSISSANPPLKLDSREKCNQRHFNMRQPCCNDSEAVCVYMAQVPRSNSRQSARNGILADRSGQQFMLQEMFK